MLDIHDPWTVIPAQGMAAYTWLVALVATIIYVNLWC